MNGLNLKIFKTYDIRGIYPTDINEKNICYIVKAIYSFFSQDLHRDNLSIVLGHDMRISSPSLFQQAKKSLVELGATVIDIGLVTTPTVYYATLKYKYDACIQISASHNPKDYNGLKFAKRVGDKLEKIYADNGMADVKRRALENDFIHYSGKGTVIKKDNILKEEVDDAFLFTKTKITKRFKVVADPANAMGSLYLSEVFKRLPCQLIKMNFELDGNFPVHQADPLQFHLLKDLQKKVIQEKADFGIAPDGDGDRVFFIDEKGDIIPASLITSFISAELLSQNIGSKILVDITNTRNVINVCKNFGGQAVISHVGHSLITEQLNRENAIFAGESSGHYYFRETGGAESSIRVVLYVLKVLQREAKPLSVILKKYISSYQSGEINFIVPLELNNKQIMDSVQKTYTNGKSSNFDGIAVDFPDWRFSIRSSNTEPLLRLNVEAKTKKLVETKTSELKKTILAFGAKAKI